jgi:KDO2-lipid IV(A) lauroyltransferase
MSVSAIVRPLSNATMQEHMSSVRRSSGMKIISKHGAGRPSLKALRRGEVLCILPDRHAGDDGALLPLFGRPTRFEMSPARFAVMSGAPIIPVWGVRRSPWLSDGRIEIRFGQTFHVRAKSREDRETATVEGTRQVIASLEEIVRAHPDQWSWMLRRWRQSDQPEGAPQ